MGAIPAVKPNWKPTSVGARRRERLLLQQLPQVRHIAGRIHERLLNRVPLDDLVQAGILGLIEAIDNYEPDKKVQLHSYAKFRVRGAILDSLRELDWGPRSLRRVARKIESAHAELRQRLGRNASEQELAYALDLGLADYQKLLLEIRGLKLCSLLKQSDRAGEDLVQFDLAAPANEEPFHRCAESEKRDLLANAMADLSEREQQVLSLHYFEELTMKEIGRLLGVVESRVSQIHRAALMSLRRRLEALQPSMCV